MIHLLDEIVLAPERVPAVLDLLDMRCLAGSRARGLTLLERWVSPPVALVDAPNTLWLLWQVADAPAYYAMRAAVDSAVIAFWSAVDQLCESRRRHVMADAGSNLPTPTEHAHAP